MFFLLIPVTLVTVLLLFLRQSKFGSKATGKRLERIRQSPNYRDGQFQNQLPTPALTEGVSYFSVLRQFFLNKNPRRQPSNTLPSQKTNLFQLSPLQDLLVWFGHSSYFIQVEGKKLLVDPVLSGAASPLRFTTRSFAGSDVYSLPDIPPIDYLVITHDHWDHLDHQTIVSLQPWVGKVICGLGTGAHLSRWGYQNDQVIELDWHDKVMLADGFSITGTPARHFSGRGLVRNKTLWMSFVLNTPTLRLFIGGDSGYGPHFKNIGQQYGPFNLALLECGQYDTSWKYIHMLPQEIMLAVTDLAADICMPVHWGKFSLANHAWDEPVKIVSSFNATKKNWLITPMIGEAVTLKNTGSYTAWWEKCP